jgi:hypothetical protein
MKKPGKIKKEITKIKTASTTIFAKNNPMVAANKRKKRPSIIKPLLGITVFSCFMFLILK